MLLQQLRKPAPEITFEFATLIESEASFIHANLQLESSLSLGSSVRRIPSTILYLWMPMILGFDVIVCKYLT